MTPTSQLKYYLLWTLRATSRQSAVQFPDAAAATAAVVPRIPLFSLPAALPFPLALLRGVATAVEIASAVAEPRIPKTLSCCSISSAGRDDGSDRANVCGIACGCCSSFTMSSGRSAFRPSSTNTESKSSGFSRTPVACFCDGICFDSTADFSLDANSNKEAWLDGRALLSLADALLLSALACSHHLSLDIRTYFVM